MKRLLLIDEKLNPGSKTRITGNSSVMSWVDKLCWKYGLGPVSTVYTGKEAVKEIIRGVHDKEVMKECLLSRIIPDRLVIRLRDKSYHSWEKQKSKAILAWRTGAIKLKDHWRVYNSKREGGVLCVSGLCDARDSWQHLLQCPFYNTKLKSDHTEDELAEFLVTINRERFVRFKSALF